MDNYRAAAYIDLKRLEENYKTIKNLLATDVGVLCVVKADAYGHGMAQVAGRLESIGADYLGVAAVNEGVELRSKGIRTPVLVMSGMMPWEEIGPFLDYNLTAVVYDTDTLRRIKGLTVPANRIVDVHLKIDTGMGRLGFSPDSISSVVEELRDVKHVRIEGVMSHFSSSEVRDEYGVEQVRVFTEILRVLQVRGVRPKFVHMANSGAITNYPEAHFNMVRAGISLYGSHAAAPLKDKLQVRQVMTVVSRIGLIREFPPGFSLSYGRGYTTTKGKTKVAYIPFGYADGYPRALSSKGVVLIKNERCNVVGKVCMDWILADVTDVEDVQVGEEVALVGGKGSDIISVDEIADLANTIPYEILCKISTRVPRVYV